MEFLLLFLRHNRLMLEVIQEESLGYRKTGFHLTDGHSNMRESATENKPPLEKEVRVKRWCKRPPVSIVI